MTDETVALCECGCGRPAPIAKMTKRRYGHVRGQPVRFIRGHRKRQPFAERFWEKIDKRGPDECWPWQAATKRGGYGAISPGGGGSPLDAHRVAWELANGRAVPDGFCVLHRCDNPPCCNARHLFIGTHGDNVADKVHKGRGRNGASPGERNGHALLTAADVRAIRRRHTWKYGSQAALGREFGVSKETIGDIVHRRSWRHVT